MVTTSRSIPSHPGLSSISVAMQTVVQTYADASVEALNVRCIPRVEFLQKMRELVQENALTRIYALLREMRSHWGQRVVYQAGTLEIHCKDMDKVPTIY